MPNIKHFIFSFLFIIQGFSGHSQAPSIDTLQAISSLAIAADSLGLYDSLVNHPEYSNLLPDSLQSLLGITDSTIFLSGKDTTLFESKSKPKGDVETTIDYKSKDSIFFDLEKQQMYLYGESEIVYGNIKLSAEKINVDWVENTLKADYVLDSTGKKIGKPVFNEAGDTYVTDDMKYNFATRKALINGIITEQDGAFMHGERVKKNEFDEMYIRGAKYTTCNLEDPHFHIQATKLKVIPNNKVLSGPFNIYFGDIPTPIGFPFGMFPQPKEKASGIIFPSYGEDFNRGFFIRQVGYYFALNDYMDLKLTGDLYSNGSFGTQLNSKYRLRYKYSGNFNLRYNKTMSTVFEDDSFSKDFWVNWSHSPESYGTSRFSASVSGGTSSFTANSNNLGAGYQANVNAQFNSNITYSKTFKGTPFNMTANARHSQNISTEQVSVTLPELSFNASRVSPFKNVKGLEDGVIGKLGFSYKMSVKNELSNAAVRTPDYVINKNPISDSLISFSRDNLSQLMDRAKQGARHQIPVSTSFNVLKNFTVSPNFNYTEVWYPKELKYTYVEEAEGVRIDTLDGFSRAGWYSTGASVSTRLYGFYPVSGGRIQAVRHVITPNVGFSYSPDFGDPSRGNYEEVQINEDGDTRFLSKYEGFAYGGPSLGENASLSFSLNNNIEMKVKTKNDSIDEYEKIKIFDNLSISTGYNFLADSFNLGNINWNARTSFFKGKMTLNLGGTIYPYTYVLDSIQEQAGGKERVYQRKLDQYAWNNGNGLGDLSRLSVAVGLKLGPKKSDGSESQDQNAGDFGATKDPLSPGQDMDINGNFGAGNVNQFVSSDPNEYVPFDVPWGLNINYNVSYTKKGYEESVITQTLMFSGNLSITNKTKINASSGYDLKRKEFTRTQIAVARDLHCWNISFNWVPFGPSQSYFVSIKVNSALLSDLKLDQRTQPSVQVF